MKAKTKSNGVTAPQGGTPRDRIGQTPAGDPAAAPKATRLWRDHASIDLGVSDVMWTLYPDLHGLEVIGAERCTDEDLKRRVLNSSDGDLWGRVRKLVSPCLPTSLRDEIIIVRAKEPPPDVGGIRDT